MPKKEASGSLLEEATRQIERELAGRQHLARGCGLALIEISSSLEEEDATLDPNIDPLGVVLVAFAARGRRLLRSAYRLLDADEPSEAVPLLRILSEYFIVGRWLLEHPDRLADWAMGDHDKRDFVYEKIMSEVKDDPKMKETLEALQKQRDELATTRDRWVEERGEPKGGIATVETMAAQIGAGFAYQLAYRVQSQADIHATPLAADACYEELKDGNLRLRSAPRHALSQYDQYELGAHTLRDLLFAVNQHLPGFMWATGLEGITAALNSARKSDPRQNENPIGAIAAAAEAAPKPATE